MKVSVSEQTARKALDVIPADTKDQDLIQLRDRLQQGLKNVTAAGTLTPDELAALVGLVQAEQFAGGPTFHEGSPLRQSLATALPKLQALLDRRLAEANAG